LVVRVLVFSLGLHDARNLKEKRMVLKSLKDRIRKRFNVSVSETGDQDLWNRAELSVAWVASDGQEAERTAARVDRFVEETGRAQILGVRSETY
jgi:uncharacterized protein YlxP (DUF503 family)